ncbi:hypothetical protein BC777_1094 [Yoonia maricola]|uniref:Lipoprotein n=1 Tax=Yoonia maricola TaxID=420999 RepID=A0A2M8WMU6_9RHOB|nr:hypothetical protein [Yoonia maricola]PJI92249.1 hypothetical protein BC777_1094 [Yoonia maricola]
MTHKHLLPVVAALTLTGCVTTSPDSYLVGTQGANNVYEFSVTHYADNVGRQSYAPLRDNLASRLCPQGYRIIDERKDVKITQAGVRQLSENVIRISCPPQ